VFNLGEGPGTLELAWKELGLPGERWTRRDLWRRSESGLRVALAPHASALYRISVP
jgi:hypothetical protein